VTLPNEPYYESDPLFPLGQHWIPTTKVDFAWRLVGYDPRYPPPVDFGPDGTIAFIDSGLDLDHREFNEGPSGSKIHHPASRSFFGDCQDPEEEPFCEGGPLCDCDPSLFPEPPEDTMVVNPDWDLLPHGTIIAGVAGAYVNGFGMAGVCWDCSILVLRVRAVTTQQSCGFPGTLCEPTPHSVAASIRYAAGWNGQSYDPPLARVISLSLNGPGFTGIECGEHDLRDAVTEAHANGCIIIIAAGNASASSSCSREVDENGNCYTVGDIGGVDITDGIAIMPNTITVGGTFMSGDVWHCWSKVNPLTTHQMFEDCCSDPNNDWCDDYYPQPWPPNAESDRLPVLSVVAPMEHTFSTWADAVPGTSNNDFQGGYPHGTSIVPPQVAGIVALMLKVDPDLTFEEVKYILESTATDITCPPAHVGYDRYTGHGLVNARAAVEYVIKQQLPADWNGDGEVAPIDAVLYNADYAAADPMTDLNLDTAQTTDDMAIFLDSYAGN